MREYKFRGKRVDNDEWVYGYYVSHGVDIYSCGECIGGKDEYYIIQPCHEDFSYENTFEVIPETIGQCTGLEDKNGKEIYEGDIVRVLNNHKEYEDGEVVMSNLGLWAVRLRGLKVPLCEFIDNRLSIVHSTERIEVIGNIYENCRRCDDETNETYQTESGIGSDSENQR